MNTNSDFTPLLDQGGPQGLPYPGYPDEWLERPVFERFVHQAHSYPQTVAIFDRKGQITYADLLQECLRLGHEISCQVPHGAPVVIALPVDRHYPAAMLASLAAGRPYVPLDLSHPPERLRHILAHCGSQHLLTDVHHESLLAKCLPTNMSLLFRDAPSKISETEWQITATADDIAYVLYTSGTSGTPKGVYQNQRGLTHDVLQYTRSSHLHPGDVLTGLYSPSVNGSLRDIYGALLNGATLLLMDLRRDGLSFAAQAIQDWGATIFHAMPPVMRSFLRSLEPSANLSSVRLVYLAGDKLPARDLMATRQRLRPEAMIYVGLGSTECATLYRQWFVPRDFTPTEGLVPSGYAVPDRVVELLDSNGQPVDQGETGQIFVNSPYLARGYWKDEDQTQAKFNPVPQHPGWTRFATGDLGRLLSNGLLVFEGRADRQIKIRGYRVEPAETEAALRSLPGVCEAAVVGVQTNDQPRLVAFVVFEDKTHTRSLEQEIRQLLPAHACPAEIISLDQLPLLSNFKVDTAALIAQAQQKPSASAGTTKADAIENCWCEILQIPSASLERSFHDEGGDSLKALELHVALEKALGRHLPVEGFRLHMKLTELYQWLEGQTQAIPRPSASRQSLQLFIFPPAGGLQADTLLLRNEMVSDMEVILVDNPPHYKRAPYSVSIGELATSLLPDVLRHYRPGHKLIFLGQSFGGRIAHEIATLMQAQGIQIDLLIITDIPRAQEFIASPIWTLKAKLANQLFRRLPHPWLLNLRKACEVLPENSWWKPRIKGLIQHNLMLHSVLFWRPLELHSPTLLLLSADTIQNNPKQPRDLGWSSICSSLKVLPLGLGHSDYAQRPNSAALKAMTLDLLSLAETTP